LATFYTKAGKAVAYDTDGIHIFLFNGRAVAYISGQSVYTYSGNHLGWYEDGWVYDHAGGCILCTEGAAGRPFKPVKQPKSMKGIRQALPPKAPQQAAPIKVTRLFSWTIRSAERFFTH
jgi:hypothetical protein